MLAAVLACALVQSPTPAGSSDPFLWENAFEAPTPEAGDQFGRSVAAAGGRAVISAWRRNGNTGGADVYRFEGGGLVHEASLSPSDGFQGSMCGTAAHLNDAGDLVVLSALGDSTLGSGAGAAYVFRRTGSTWREEAKLLAPDGAAGDGFSNAVAVGDDVIVVGAPGVDLAPGYYAAGAVYVFEFNGTDWAASERFVLPDIDGGDRFGQEISLRGGSFVVGVAAKDNEFGDNAGAAYVYSRQQGLWQLEERVTPPGLATGSSFGRAVALDGDRLLVSSNVSGGLQMAGTVHAFERGANGWAESDRFGAPTPQAFDFFGENLALHGKRALVSSRKAALADRTAVYAYDLGSAGSEWLQTMTQPFPAGSHVGSNSDVDLTGEFAIVGESLHGMNVGAAPSFVDVYRALPSLERAGTPRPYRR